MPLDKSGTNSQGEDSAALRPRSGSDSTLDENSIAGITNFGILPAQSSGVPVPTSLWRESEPIVGSYTLASNPRIRNPVDFVPRSSFGLCPEDIFAEHNITLSSSPPDIEAWLQKIKSHSGQKKGGSDLSKPIEERNEEEEPEEKDPSEPI